MIFRRIIPWWSNHEFSACGARLNSSFAPGLDFAGFRLDRLSDIKEEDSSLWWIGCFELEKQESEFSQKR